MHKISMAFLLALSFALSGFAPAKANIGGTHPDFDMQRCVNMGNSFEAPSDLSWGKPLDVADFLKIKNAGFDTVRIPVRWSDYTGPAPDFTINSAFMARVDLAVTEALSQDLNVILNIHHFEEIMDRPTTEFKRLVAMWRQISTHFAPRSKNLWFETLNEPHGKLEGKLMQAAQTASVLAIRETNPERLIILGGKDWSNVRSLSSNIVAPDDNIIYTYHYYDPFDFTHQKATWLGKDMPKGTRRWKKSDLAQLERDTESVIEFRMATGHPVFVGEFGAYEKIDNKDRVAYVNNVRQSLEANNIPWCLWSFSNTFALYNAQTDVWDDDMMLALGLKPQNQPKLKTKIISEKASDVSHENWGRFHNYYAGTSDYLKDVLTGVAVINPGDEIHPPHQHAEEEFLMVIEGSGTWTIGKKTIAANAGDIMYSEPWVRHGLRNTGSDPLRFVVFKYNPIHNLAKANTK